MTEQERMEYNEKLNKATDGIIKSFEREIEEINALARSMVELTIETENLLYLMKHGAEDATKHLQNASEIAAMDRKG